MLSKIKRSTTFTFVFALTSIFVLCQGKCKKEKDFVETKITIDFEGYQVRGIKNLAHPVTLFKFPSHNIAGGNGTFGGFSMGIIADGNGNPIPSSQKCKLATICGSNLKDTWSGWLEVYDSNGKSLYSRDLSSITTNQLFGNSVIIKVLKSGERCKVAVLLREPCYNVINNSHLIFQSNGGFPGIPFSSGHCRETYYGELGLNDGKNDFELFLHAKQNFGSGCEICN